MGSVSAGTMSEESPCLGEAPVAAVVLAGSIPVLSVKGCERRHDH